MLEIGKKRKNRVWNIMIHGGCSWFGSGVVFDLGLEKGSGEGKMIRSRERRTRKKLECLKLEFHADFST